MYRNLIITLFLAGLLACHSAPPAQQQQTGGMGPLKVSENGRYFTTADGAPFFWLGDTGWLLFTKLTREETEKYLEDRRKKGFNVIQVMVLHTLSSANVYGDSALAGRNVATPRVTEGSAFEDTAQYDFWDHMDYVIDKAAEKGIYMALVPVWGSNVKSGRVSPEQARAYTTFLAERCRSKPNIIWLNGGDIRGDDSLQVWQTIGATLQATDTAHLITYHPRGRFQSSTWFHQEPWLHFNMFQSGHRRYEQDTSAGELHYGEDNWRYIEADYAKTPVKPTLDGEPSYEDIPQGLHDSLQPRWKDSDVRRYAYWSVFAGGCGFTYGNNAVMQMHRPNDQDANYGVSRYWYDAINDPGASQMIYLKNLMLSRPYFERVPDQSLVAGPAGDKYDHLAATRGKDYAFVYTYNGRNFSLNMGKIGGEKVKAAWYSPRDGSTTEIGVLDNKGVHEFDPPGEQKDGNDWVLIMDKTE